MSWFKRKTKIPKRRVKKKPASRHTAQRLLAAVKMLRHTWIVALAVAAVWIVGRLEGYLAGRPEFLDYPTIVLTDAPDDLHDRIMQVIAPLSQVPWTDPELCSRIGRALEQYAWVREVRSVRRYADGRVTVSCAYRSAAALVQIGGDYYLIDPDGVRLPGRFSYHPSFVVVQGTDAMPPEPGATWPGGDIKAGLKILRLLQQEPFFDQLTGVLVGNYLGRRDKHKPHILLATAPAGGRIVWGSAPGEEIEENTAQRKIMLLRENYRRWGRIDAGRDYIDISTYPDRLTTRAPA